MIPWIRVEDGRLINLSLVTDIVPDEIKGHAAAWCSGVILFGHSKILYDYYLAQNKPAPSGTGGV